MNRHELYPLVEHALKATDVVWANCSRQAHDPGGCYWYQQLRHDWAYITAYSPPRQTENQLIETAYRLVMFCTVLGQLLDTVVHCTATNKQIDEMYDASETLSNKL